MTEDMENDGYKIVEPRKPPSDREKHRKAKQMENGLKMSILTEKNLDALDSDNIFSVCDRTDKMMCILTKLPCANPHCTSCNLMFIKGNDAEFLLDAFTDYYVDERTKELKATMDSDLKNALDTAMNMLKKIIEGDNNE